MTGISAVVKMWRTSAATSPGVLLLASKNEISVSSQKRGKTLLIFFP